MVSGAFTDKSVAGIRVSTVELAWAKAKAEKAHRKLMIHSKVWKLSVKDALCIDAFPLCHDTDKTLCMMACRNIQVCFEETCPISDDDASIDDILKRCEKLCANTTGNLYEKINVSAIVGTGGCHG